VEEATGCTLFRYLCSERMDPGLQALSQDW
jgi:hypothetical protein